MTRGTKLKLNMLTTIIYQIVSILSGFILPRFFLRYYGSEVNGLVSSITQFLAVITLCECGVGAVVQTALFKPIAENDEKEISRIYKSSTKFFNKIAIILIVYTAILVFAYPHIVNKSFDTLYTGVLIITLSISLLAQYYFAITYKLILNAAQLIYIQMIVSTVSLVLNVVISIVLMYMGMSIQIVKLASAGIFVLQPLVYKYAVDHRFNIDRNIVLNGEPIKQKWNGLAQHLATVILENTDVLVLTFFSNNRGIGRIAGMTIPTIFLSTYILLFFFSKNKPNLDKNCIRYALLYSIPIIPHSLSQIILNQFDRIMITSIVGESESGIYSFAYTMFSILLITITSIDKIWGPWFFDNLKENNYLKIKKTSTQYGLLMAVISSLLMLIAPEIIKFLGPKEYWNAIYCVIPIVIGGYFSFLYYIPCQVEYYYAKTKYIAFGSILAAIVNIILNSIFIHQYGYIAAAYTTLISYLLYFLFHY